MTITKISTTIIDYTTNFIQDHGEIELYEYGMDRIIPEESQYNLMLTLMESDIDVIVDEFLRSLEENEHTEVIIEDLILNMMDDEENFPDDKMIVISEHDILSEHCPIYSMEDSDVLF